MNKLIRYGTLALAVLAVAGVAWVGHAWWTSRLPDTYNVMDYGTPDYGGGPVAAGGHDHDGSAATSVARLTGPRSGTPDAAFTLTAKRAEVRLASGRTVDALTFNGAVPGPELRVRKGDLVEVTLVNEDVAGGVSVHWHGLDVPNAEDGVAGVTQDAVEPGSRFVYRFRADQTGTFWYHTHQAAAREVQRGLFGALVVEPRAPAPAGALDATLVAHHADGVLALNGNDGLARRAVPAGTPVRLRLVNAVSTPKRFAVSGTSFRVVAIDGTDLNRPGSLRDVAVKVPAGGRYDIGFTMPERPVAVGLPDSDVRTVLSRDGTAARPAPPEAPDFDPISYGRPAATPFGAASDYDRSFRFDIGRKLGFFDGRPGFHWTINVGIYPDVPVFVVRPDELVKMTIHNGTDVTHPMHLHGHHVLVLSRNGKRVSGSPWWSDTLGVEPDETYDVAFRTDNPGLWMDHCHNLLHAADGLTMHLAYEGVTTPYLAGGAAHNHPE